MITYANKLQTPYILDSSSLVRFPSPYIGHRGKPPLKKLESNYLCFNPLPLEFTTFNLDNIPLFC